MSDHHDPNQLDTTDLGWRIQQLRLRRGYQQKALASRAGVDAAFLNRLEHGSSRRSRPKPETVHRLLDALGATPEEREAVFHVETSPPTQVEIEARIAEIAADVDGASDPFILQDERWFRYYINNVGRRMFRLDDDDYRRTVGTHVLAAYVDPEHPLYTRYREEEREYHFARRVIAFKTLYASQQFDRWYLDLERYMRRFPLGRRIWERPEVVAPPMYLLSQEVSYLDASGQKYMLMGSVNFLTKDRRFWLVHLQPMDEETRRLLNSLHDETEAQPPG